MVYNFWADAGDTVSIFEWVFADGLQVYDLTSNLGENVRGFKAVDDLAKSFDLSAERKSQLTFQLWSPRHGGKPIFRKVSLDPIYCDGHTFRYATEGYGMIQLYLGGIRRNSLARSTLSHMSERRATLFEVDRPSELGKASDWNWKEIQRTSRRLKYQIHERMAVEKIGGFGILAGAKSLFDRGMDRVL